MVLRIGGEAAGEGCRAGGQEQEQEKDEEQEGCMVVEVEESEEREVEECGAWSTVHLKEQEQRQEQAQEQEQEQELYNNNTELSCDCRPGSTRGNGLLEEAGHGRCAPGAPAGGGCGAALSASSSPFKCIHLYVPLFATNKS